VWARSAAAAPAADGLYATVQTTLGEFCFELYYTNAPRTVANFVGLAEGARAWMDPRNGRVTTAPYYRDILFHRVIEGFMIQCGSPQGTGSDGPGYTFEDEFDPALRHDGPGVVSMANSGPNSNGGQFFVTVAETSWLDGVHSVFGRVVEGLDTVYAISRVPTNANSRPLTDVVITNLFITRNGATAAAFSVTNWDLPVVTPLPMAPRSGAPPAFVAAAGEPICERRAFRSADLANWSQARSDYAETPPGEWLAPTDPAAPRVFYHAARTQYVLPYVPTSLAGHVVSADIGGDLHRVELAAADTGGMLTVGGNAPTAIAGREYDRVPCAGQLLVQTDPYGWLAYVLHFNSPTGGRCEVYQYTADGWVNAYDAAGTFTVASP